MQKNKYELETKVIDLLFAEGETLEEIFSVVLTVLACIAHTIEVRDERTAQSAAPSGVKPKVSGMGRKGNSKKPKRASRPAKK